MNQYGHTYRSVSPQPLSLRQQVAGHLGFEAWVPSPSSTQDITSHRGAQGVGVEAACGALNPCMTRELPAKPLRSMNARVAPTGAPKGGSPVHLETAEGFDFPLELPVRSDSGLWEMDALSNASMRRARIHGPAKKSDASPRSRTASSPSQHLPGTPHCVHW
jgi:hypothetical protein